MPIAYRLAAYPEAFWKLPNRSAARFHALGDPPTQYLALHPLTAWAEVIRNSRLPRAALRDFIPRSRLWVARVELGDLLELDFDSAASFGITPVNLVADNHAACRALGQRLRSDGVAGIIHPSSALPGTRSICLFGERHESPYLLDPIGPLDVPTSVGAEDGAALRSLLDLVRLHGEAHDGLEAHLRGVIFSFTEPDFTIASAIP